MGKSLVLWWILGSDQFIYLAVTVCTVLEDWRKSHIGYKWFEATSKISTVEDNGIKAEAVFVVCYSLIMLETPLFVASPYLGILGFSKDPRNHVYCPEERSRA